MADDYVAHVYAVLMSSVCHSVTFVRYFFICYKSSCEEPLNKVRKLHVTLLYQND